MNTFPVKTGYAILQSIRGELESLQEHVPMFARWQIPELRRICERYSNVLIWISWWDDYQLRCLNLLNSLPEIQAQVNATMASGDWRSFNKAAIALQMDMEELMQILE